MRKAIRIHIGGLHASSGSAIIETTLGSCVAVCLYVPVEKIGGMNHILLPGKADLLHFDSAARYGVNAMELLINRIMSIGGNRFQLVAKVFGGAHLFPSISIENGVGKKNAEFDSYEKDLGKKLTTFDFYVIGDFMKNFAKRAANGRRFADRQGPLQD